MAIICTSVSLSSYSSNLSRPGWIKLDQSGFSSESSFQTLIKDSKAGMEKQRVGVFSPLKTSWNAWGTWKFYVSIIHYQEMRKTLRISAYSLSNVQSSSIKWNLCKSLKSVSLVILSTSCIQFSISERMLKISSEYNFHLLQFENTLNHQ